MRAVVPRGGVGGERVAGGLHEGAAQREGAEPRGRGVQGGAHLTVHRRQERLVGALHDGRQAHQQQRAPPVPLPPLHDPVLLCGVLFAGNFIFSTCVLVAYYAGRASWHLFCVYDMLAQVVSSLWGQHATDLGTEPDMIVVYLCHLVLLRSYRMHYFARIRYRLGILLGDHAID